jgi:hypothetical protein
MADGPGVDDVGCHCTTITVGQQPLQRGQPNGQATGDFTGRNVGAGSGVRIGASGRMAVGSFNGASGARVFDRVTDVSEIARAAQ